MRKPERRTKGAIEKWEIRNDIAYYATYSSAQYDASAKKVADTYHKECVDGDSPREPRAHELMERLVHRFALDKQKTTESVQTEYSDWKIASGEDPMSAVDRLRKIILRLKNLGQEQTELSKITRFKKGLKVERLSELTGHMAVQPAGITIEGYYVTVVKSLADASFPAVKLSEQKMSVNSISDERPVKKCKYKLCGKMGHLEKDCRKKRADSKKRKKQKAELTSRSEGTEKL